MEFRFFFRFSKAYLGKINSVRLRRFSSFGDWRNYTLLLPHSYIVSMYPVKVFCLLLPFDLHRTTLLIHQSAKLKPLLILHWGFTPYKCSQCRSNHTHCTVWIPKGHPVRGMSFTKGSYPSGLYQGASSTRPASCNVLVYCYGPAANPLYHSFI